MTTTKELELLKHIIDLQEKTVERLANFKKSIVEIKNELERYRDEDEVRYRDLVKKILDVDNELNRKFRALGEEIIDMKKKMIKRKKQLF